MTEGRAAAILKTLDIATTIQWYTTAGFELRGQFPDTDPTWCEVGRDGLVVQFVAGDTPWEGPPSLTGCLYLYPPSVDAVHAELSSVVELEWGVEEREWGTKELVVQDPNGYFLTFSEG